MIICKLNGYLRDRHSSFLNVNMEQKETWAANIVREIMGVTLHEDDDDDMFCNTRPREVKYR